MFEQGVIIREARYVDARTLLFSHGKAALGAGRVYEALPFYAFNENERGPTGETGMRISLCRACEISPSQGTSN